MRISATACRLTVILLLLVLGLTTNALAHKVNLFAYVEGGRIFCESYFPDGRAVSAGKVLVYDQQKKLLLEGKNDNEGLFSFTIPQVSDLTIVIEASMGHKNSYLLKKAEVELGQ